MKFPSVWVFLFLLLNICILRVKTPQRFNRRPIYIREVQNRVSVLIWMPSLEINLQGLIKYCYIIWDLFKQYDVCSGYRWGWAGARIGGGKEREVSARTVEAFKDLSSSRERFSVMGGFSNVDNVKRKVSNDFFFFCYTWVLLVLSIKIYVFWADQCSSIKT